MVIDDFLPELDRFLANPQARQEPTRIMDWLAAIDQRLAEPGRTDQDRVEYGERRERLLDLRRDPPGALGLSAS